MHDVQAQPLPEVGNFLFEVYGSGRNGRHRSSRFQLRCDAIGMHDDQMLLLSVIGPETSVKALTAGLRSSGRDQRRIDYTVHAGNINRTHLARCPEGYRIYRTKFDYGLWHVLCLGKREGFMPVMTEETIWQLLQKDQFTTPLLREWVPWLLQTMKKQGAVIPLTQYGCQAGLLLADNETLDTLVCEGIQNGHLGINGQTIHSFRRKDADPDEEINNLDEYMLRHGALLGKQAERSLDPLHVPGRDRS